MVLKVAFFANVVVIVGEDEKSRVVKELITGYLSFVLQVSFEV